MFSTRGEIGLSDLTFPDLLNSSRLLMRIWRTGGPAVCIVVLRSGGLSCGHTTLEDWFQQCGELPSPLNCRRKLFREEHHFIQSLKLFLDGRFPCSSSLPNLLNSIRLLELHFQPPPVASHPPISGFRFFSVGNHSNDLIRKLLLPNLQFAYYHLLTDLFFGNIRQHETDCNDALKSRKVQGVDDEHRLTELVLISSISTSPLYARRCLLISGHELNKWEPKRIGAFILYSIIITISCQKVYVACTSYAYRQSRKELTEAYMEALIPDPTPANVKK
ncbi:hypothetical protein KSP40_PGU018069 [Platanthera guangdongensis]|uniref:Uncharacterized protein n=1 Tax=Platanthera guangdongensis TaxID=2320717 RepID=A0ABR2MBQ3_9ASPA